MVNVSEFNAYFPFWLSSECSAIGRFIAVSVGFLDLSR